MTQSTIEQMSEGTKQPTPKSPPPLTTEGANQTPDRAIGLLLPVARGRATHEENKMSNGFIKLAIGLIALVIVLAVVAATCGGLSAVL